MTVDQLTQQFSSLSPALAGKLDAYFWAAINTRFADVELGKGTAPTVAIGFTVAASSQFPMQVVKASLLALFAAATQCRLTKSLLSFEANGRAYLTADVDFSVLLLLILAPYVEEIQLCANTALARPVPRRVANPGSRSTDEPPLRTAEKKILALIDHGCPFAHRDFQNSGTRIWSIWDQDPEPDFPVADGTTPTGFGYGRQIARATLQSYIPVAFDEDDCYRRAEYSAMRHRYSHGGMVLGLLAGNRIGPSLSPTHKSEPTSEGAQVDVIFVQLPRAVLLAPNRGNIDRCILDGLAYVLDCAPDNAHIVANVDYGTEMGSHDGDTWFEKALDNLIGGAAGRNIKLEVVFPSGNSFQERRHAVLFPIFNIAPPTDSTVNFWLPPGNDSPVLVEIWIPDQTANFQFTVTPPGLSATPLKFPTHGDCVRIGTSAGQTTWVVVNRACGAQRQILLQISPTAFGTSGRPMAMAGVWNFNFTKLGASAIGPIHLYTSWGGKNPGFPQRTLAGKFIPDANHPNAVERSGAILGSACGSSGNVHMVGGHEKWGTLDRAFYSSSGPARGGKRSIYGVVHSGADLTAVTEEAPSSPGVLCLGNKSAGLVRARGTSFAAPQLARRLITSPALVTRPAPSPSSSAGRIKNRPEFGEPRLA